ncbi:MAG TPA: PhzF family phenazine biosynthesis protein [Longimicrobiales bacterium]|nr:PhzF family phenazine biosynthesis protein [Longimicrobiales bacterium]
MRLIQVDAFTAEAFRGNPAAVCILDAPRDDDWMAAVAREMNLSETAFLERRDDGWGLRWFTPAVEVELCGHATLASAHVLWELEPATPDETLRFHTRSGVLTARRAGDRIVLDFPAEPATTVPWVAPLLEALGVAAPVAFARNRFDYLVEVADAAQVRALRPDMARLATVPTRGVIVTARSDVDGFDFVSRWFGPRSGVDEDPVTGSAHCCLGPWWAERLGRTELRAVQLSARTGVVGVRVLDGRVELTGSAVTVLRGELVA